MSPEEIAALIARVEAAEAAAKAAEARAEAAERARERERERAETAAETLAAARKQLSGWRHITEREGGSGPLPEGFRPINSPFKITAEDGESSDAFRLRIQNGTGGGLTRLRLSYLVTDHSTGRTHRVDQDGLDDWLDEQDGDIFATVEIDGFTGYEE